MGFKKVKKNKLYLKFILFFAIIALVGSNMLLHYRETKAATYKSADIRFIFTTDLHGRLTTKDYELGEDFNTGSLAKAYTLIKKARSEKEEGNSFLFDIGDVLYDYTTESIFELDQGAVQPMYQVMNTLGYDALVLGNHEFDYGFDYINKQMQASGLKNICVVSNLFNAKTKNTAFEENKIISREVTAKDGSKVTIDVGIIGETVPALSKKRENYTGVLETEDIITNVKKEAKKLKDEGADIIVVLAHSGFGTEEPTEFSKNVSYALTKINEVDAVLCGHEHNMFPSASAASKDYYTLSGVDKTSGLVNGKNLVMASDKGQSIGLVDLTVKITDTKKEITKRSSKVWQVKASTAADATINNSFGKWAEVFGAAATNVVGKLSGDTSLNNYLGLVEDTNSIQLLNNSKIYYALQYIYSKGNQFTGYPIIAASNHNRTGQLSSKDYANIKGELTEANLSAIAPFNKYVFLYEVTGKQVKEWLEWSASAYQTTDDNVEWTDETMNKVMKTSGASSLISEDWLDEWSNFFVFDGISYTIDPSVAPRYNYEGKLINHTNRIVSMTCNGAPVNDDMKFILATDPLTNNSIEALTTIENKPVLKGINKNLTLLVNYVKSLSASGEIKPTIDDNWKIFLPDGYNFILKVSQYAGSEFGEYNWEKNLASNIDEYNYFNVKYKRNDKDTIGPNLVVASANEKSTNKNIKIAVSASDSSEISTIRYMYGDYEKSYPLWHSATEVINAFTVAQNGVYTVYAEDKNGNSTIAKININNINKGILQAPVINSYTNRTTRITGTAEPNAAIYFKTSDGEYESKVNADGTFAYELPSQCAGATVSIYIKDASGRASDTTVITTKRTGPNRPSVEEIKNTVLQITGKTNDMESVSTIMAIAGNNVFVSDNGGAEVYKKCDKYVDTKQIIETKVKVQKDGSYSILTNGINAGTQVTVYSVDFAGRLSKANITKVIEAGPNPPVLYTITNVENQVSGKIFTKDGVKYGVTVSVDGKTYNAIPDTDGYFTVNVEEMQSGEDIKLYVTDVVDNVTRTSAVITKQVQDIDDVISSNTDQIMFMDDINDKSTSITGSCSVENAVIIIKYGEEFNEIMSDEEGNFELVLTSPIEVGTKVTAVYRKDHSNEIEAASKTVILGLPDQPELLNRTVYNTTKVLKVLSKETVSITVEIGKENYTSSEFTYDASLGCFVYEIKIKNVDSGNTISIFATNSAGNSTKLKVPVIQRAPDAPIITQITSNTTVIKGKVNLILDEVNMEIPTVANTGTVVCAKIGKKVYKAVIKDDGTFEIKIPKQKAKTTIEIWGKNSLGIGPVNSAIVKK